MAKKNTLVVGYNETKDVLLLVIGLGRAYEQMKADGKINIADLMHLLPILFLVGPAIEGFENVQLELKMANKEEGEELKAWVRENVNLQDKSVEEFIEACFAIVLDIWMVFRTYFFPEAGQSMLIKPNQPKDVSPSTADVAEENTNGVEIDLATPTAE